MRKIYLLFFSLMAFVQGFSQTTVFSDAFGTDQGTTYTTSGAIGASPWSVNRSGADWGARITNGVLELSNDVSGTANANGWVFASVNTSSFSTPYNTTLGLNSGTVTWTFNMRQPRDNPAGFGSGSYGAAFILAGSTNTPNNSGDGYAVVLGGSGTTDPLRLIRYTGGLVGSTDLITSNTAGLTDFGTDYLSIRVTYTPSTNTWELFLRNDGTTAFVDPATGTLVSQGTTTDATFTSTSLGFLGGYWQGSTAANQSVVFDNLVISVAGSTGSPAINVAPSTLSGFSYAVGSGPSTPQQFAVSAADLSPAAGNITITAPASYEISADGSSWTSTSFTLPYTGGTLSSTNVFVRLKAGLSTGTYNETVTLAGGGANSSVTVNGAVTAVPDIALSSPNPAVAAGNVAQNSFNYVIYRFELAVTSANATLNGLSVTTTGTYTATDVTNLKVWYSTSATFATGTSTLLSTLANPGTAGVKTFTPFTSQVINAGTTGYIYITADVPCAATVGNTIAVNAVTTGDISFVSGNETGSAFAGDAQTIASATPNNPSSFTAVPGNMAATLTWSNPSGCYDEVLIVGATAANTGTPTSDGSAYTGNLAYGSGTTLGNGFVVYKGTTSPQTVTGLTNGTTYYFKLFTRKGTNWSAGVEVSVTPSLQPGPGDIVINQFSPDYGASGDEYIELVNKTNNTYDLSGLAIRYQSAGGTSGGAGGTLSGTLGAKRFWLLSPNATINVGQTNGLARDGAITAGFAASGQFALVRLSDNVVIDAVGYGTLTGGTYTETAAAPASPTDGGIKRVTDGVDTDNNSVDFATVDNVNILLRNSLSNPLPVRFSALKATQKGNTVQLDWSNATEENVTAYTIERSANGRSFTQIGLQTARNNNNDKASYTFVDGIPFAGDNFYRIKATETTGRTVYTNVVRINTSKKGTELIVYPNPLKGSDLNVQLSNLPAGKYAVKVFNMAGQEMDSRVMNHAGGSVSETISIKNLKPGLYTLQLSGAVTLQKAFIAE